MRSCHTNASTLAGFDRDDRGEAHRILYALDAILRLHSAQEEELLVSLTSDHATPG